MDFQFPDNTRKFSLSWPPQQQHLETGSPLAAFATNPPNTPLLDINIEQVVNGNFDVLLAAQNGDHDISSPLLPESTSNSRHIQLQNNFQNPPNNRENFPKYVNLQLGELSNDRSVNLPMEEQATMQTGLTSKEPEHDSFL